MACCLFRAKPLSNAGWLSIAPLETNFSEIAVKIATFTFKETHLNKSDVWNAEITLGGLEISIQRNS